MSEQEHPGPHDTPPTSHVPAQPGVGYPGGPHPTAPGSPGYPGYEAPTWSNETYQAPGRAPGQWDQPSGQAYGYGQNPGQNPGQDPGQDPGRYHQSQDAGPAAGYQQTAEQPTLPGFAWPPNAPEYPAPAEPGRRNGRLRVGIAGLVAGALIGGGAAAGVVALVDRPTATQVTSNGAPSQDVVIKDPQNATSATAAAGKAAPSVATVYVTSGQSAGSGSGVVLSADGYVLTNNHVVTLEGTGSGTATVQVRTADGALYDATVVGTDPVFDLAVIKLQGASGLKPASFGDSDKVQVGDLAVAIGAPLGLSNTVTDGIISATNRAVATGSTQNDTTVIDAIQTDAAINPGNSGGALVNAAGEVVGINTAIASVASQSLGNQSQQSGNIGVGFAIPSNTAKRIANELIKNGKSTHAVLGVSARTQASGANPEVGTGAQIAQVQPGGSAANAGLQVGDVITAVGSRAVTTSTELTAAVRSSTPGGKVTLTVRRGGSTQKIDVTLASTN